MFHLFMSRWMLVAVCCLFAGTIFVSGEWVAGQGNNGLFDILWLLLTLCGLGVLLVQEKMQPDTDTVSKGKIGFTISTADILWFVLMMVSLFSAGYHLATFSGNPRYGMNVTSAWVGCGVTWLLFRWTIRSFHHLLVLAAVLISVSTTLAVLATYRYYVEIPQLIADYEKDPENMLAQLNLDPRQESAERILFESRLRTQRPVGTYSLTNTLAGLLAPTIVLASGLFFTLIAKVRVEYRKIGIFGIWIFCIFAMLCCLFLTHSRSGVIAVFVGWTYLAAVFLGQKIKKRSFSLIAGVLVLIIVAVTTGTVMTQSMGRDLSKWMEPAKRSLGFRLEYWQASLQMIQDSPLVGCGPGNFQSKYVQYKLPQSSEEIADPHNFLVELAAVFGIPTAVIFLLFVASLLLPRTAKPSSTTETQSSQSTEPMAEQTAISRAVVVAGTFGIVLGFVVSQPFDIAVPLVGLLFGVVLFPPILWMLLRSIPTVLSLEQATPFRLIFAATLVSFLTNLCAAGGMLYPNLFVVFWFCCAALYLFSRSTLRENNTRADMCFPKNV